MSRKYGVALLVLCLSFGIAYGVQKPEGSGIVSGSVVDAFHAPIAGAYILLHSSGVSDVRATTDQNGRFSATVRPGIYDVFVASNGFAPKCDEVNVEEGKLVQYNTALKPSAFLNDDYFGTGVPTQPANAPDQIQQNHHP